MSPTPSSEYSFASFTSHAHAIAQRFEERRAQFLRRLKFRSAVALVLLLTFPIWFSLMRNLDNTDGALSSLGWVIVHIIAGAVIVVCIVAYAVMPLFRYRHYTAQLGSTLPGVSGVVQQHVSLKGEIFSQLFSYFGNFALYNDRRLALRALRGAPNMPEFDEFSSEDYIKGALDGVTVELTEAALLVHRQRDRVPIFNGLMIVLDINDSSLVLRGKFSGRTVVIADRSLAREYVAVKYGDFRRVAMPDTSFDQRFEAFSTDTEEAGRLLSADLLRDLLRLSDAVGNARHQVRHADDKVAYAISGIATGISDAMAMVAEGLLNWFKTGSASSISRRHEVSLPETAIAADAKSLNQSVHCAFYNDKVLITIPCRKNLFEPDMIFRPPLHEDDLKLVYDLMTMVAGIARAVVAALPKEMV